LRVNTLHFLLTLVAAAAVVSAVSAVGIVLVVSLMAAPALLAMPKARSLQQALLRSALWGLLLSGAGFVVAVQPSINLPPGPVIGVICMATLPLQLLRR
jgi:zinc/manganese transport system permease protein